MRRVGTVERVAQGLVVALAADDDLPDVGTTVVDEDLADAGRVVSVFGPVESPYVAVHPGDRNPASLFGEALYAR